MIKKLTWSEPILNNLPQKISKDIIISSSVDITTNELEADKPIILFEKRDGAYIGKKSLLRHKNVVRYIKQYALRNVHDNNQYCIDGRFFTRFLTDCANTQHNIPLDDNDLAKIRLGTNFLHYSCVKPFIELKPTMAKDIDLFFAGTTIYGDENSISGKLITLHRQNLVKILSDLSHKYKVIVQSCRNFPKSEYIKIIARSKVVISPWGWGEACYRDYESLLSCCVVIKPKTDFIISVPDIWNEDYFTFCSPDWSDIETAIQRALELSRNKDILFARRNLLLKYSTKDFVSSLIGELCSY